MPFGIGRNIPAGGDSAPIPATVALDKTNGVPAAAVALSQWANGDWRAVESEHGQSPDWDTRAAVAQALGDMDVSEEWTASCPRSALAWAVRGAQLRRLAWDIRGGGVASTVPKTAWGDFFATLGESERALGLAAELAPADPYPWSQLIWTGTGLNVSKDDVLQRFAAMWERDPGHIYGWLAVISCVGKKWGGSHELMFDVARQGDRKLPAGSLGRVGIVRAHEERRLYLSVFEQDKEGAQAYFKRAEVAHEISAAASNSVLSEFCRAVSTTRLAQSWFAYGLALAGDVPPGERLRAASLFLQLGNEGIPSNPWQLRYGARGGEQYARIRAVCYSAAA